MARNLYLLSSLLQKKITKPCLYTMAWHETLKKKWFGINIISIEIMKSWKWNYKLPVSENTNKKKKLENILKKHSVTQGLFNLRSDITWQEIVQKHDSKLQ